MGPFDEELRTAPQGAHGSGRVGAAGVRLEGRWRRGHQVHAALRTHRRWHGPRQPGLHARAHQHLQGLRLDRVGSAMDAVGPRRRDRGRWSDLAGYGGRRRGHRPRRAPGRRTGCRGRPRCHRQGVPEHLGDRGGRRAVGRGRVQVGHGPVDGGGAFQVPVEHVLLLLLQVGQVLLDQALFGQGLRGHR